ncbi:flagellar biosynthetic protein FliO [Billgrantia endophytica]|uniref:Flagellar protein n=1 Tax=Billgrantia endophytica TaxID=2033802 RepID=A0A2N7UBD8_9GAMM|nr:flagellar biosynthetic protein FliO [Halomonas endophytica]PMR77715.1 flagellar biosynthetic protein FliO [Halomonas endophytica]
MSDTPSTEATATGLEALSVGGDALVGMATLGKTAAALALVIAIILVCTSLLKRWGPQRRAAGGHLRVIGSTALGPRERLVLVEVEGTWLVLGVGGGQISKLHELDAPERPVVDSIPDPVQGERFAARFARALKQNAGLGGPGRGES